ncbi:MAG: hypothetical protein ACREGI_01675, partial [Candidatus Levyibacteriota bacterium]
MKRIVVKIGGSITSLKREKIEGSFIASLARQAKTLQKEGFELIFVISGAVYFGEHILSLSGSVTDKRLAAGVGQAYLTSYLHKAFSAKKLSISQMLLEKEDTVSEEKGKELREIFERAFEKKIIMILNENDILDLNSFSGNDFLASYIAKLVTA